MRTVLTRAAGALLVSLLAMSGAACGSGTGPSASHGPSIVVTSNILGDVVRQVIGAAAHVEVVMPPNTDPHEFSASARQAADMRDADVLVTNGLGFESGLTDTIDAARSDGVHVLAVAPLAPHLRTLSGSSAHGGPAVTDPHVFTDPARMAVAVARLATALEHQVPALDTAAVKARAAAYVISLRTLDTSVATILARVPASRRILVTNHDALGYFADRYGFTVLGTVIPSLSTVAEPSASDLSNLASAIDRAAVPAIFADTSSPKRLAQALATEGHHVRVVELFVESLGQPGSGAATYEEMVRTNAERIASTLG